MSSEIASTMVVMNGDAITAGSKPSFSAKSGIMQPTTLAQTTVSTNVRHTVSATVGVIHVLPSTIPSKSMIFAKLTAARVMPQKSATRSSFHTTLRMSLNSIS